MNSLFTMLICCCPTSLNMQDMYYRNEPAVKLPSEDEPEGERISFSGSVLFPGRYCVTIHDLARDRIFTFPYARCLLDGEVDPRGTDRDAYLPTNLHPGDQIALSVEKVERKYVIARIMLFRRGDDSAIPPSQNPHPQRPYHVWQNALNRWEQKGIAIPDNILKQFGKTEHPRPPRKADPKK